jgi:hypothetical protein
MFASAVKIMFSGWYFLLIPFFFPLLDVLLSALTPVNLIANLDYLFIAVIVLDALKSAAIWSFLAFFAHKTALKMGGCSLRALREAFGRFAMCFLVLSLIIDLPNLVQLYVITIEFRFNVSSSSIVFYSIANLIITAILALVVLSVAGILLPAALDDRQNWYQLAKSQGMANSLRTSWLILRWPGSVYIALITINLAVWAYTGEAPESSLVNAILNQSGFAQVLLRTIANGLIVVLTAMVLSRRYIEVRGEASL